MMDTEKELQKFPKKEVQAAIKIAQEIGAIKERRYALFILLAKRNSEKTPG